MTNLLSKLIFTLQITVPPNYILWAVKWWLDMAGWWPSRSQCLEPRDRAKASEDVDLRCFLVALWCVGNSICSLGLNYCRWFIFYSLSYFTNCYFSVSFKGRLAVWLSLNCQSKVINVTAGANWLPCCRWALSLTGETSEIPDFRLLAEISTLLFLQIFFWSKDLFRLVPQPLLEVHTNKQQIGK